METRKDTEETLSKHLHLTRKFHCAVFDRDIAGWLQKTRDYVTWGPIDEDTYKQLCVKRKVKDVNLFRLHPPVGGFKHSTKKHFPKGELGKRDGDSMKKLLLKMM